MNNPLSGTDPTGYAAEDNTMTGSRIKGVDTGASGAAFGAKAEMGSRKADSGASKSQTAQKADVKVDKINSPLESSANVNQNNGSGSSLWGGIKRVGQRLLEANARGF